MKIEKILIHPVVILNILKYCDGIEFPSQKNKKTIGCLLGNIKQKIISCTSSFRIPFDGESEKLWFLDHNFLEKMAGMYKKVNGRENVIGWYGVKKNHQQIDLSINKIFLGYSPHPIFILFWMEKNASGFFLEAFSESKKFGKQNYFKTLPIKFGMLESEEIGVFQILRDSDWKRSGKISQTSRIWAQILSSFSKFLKKKFLKTSSNFNFSKNQMFNFFDLKTLVKKTSSISFEKKIFENNLFFLYSATLLKGFISIERVLKLSLRNF